MDHLFEETSAFEELGVRRRVRETWKPIGSPRSHLSYWVKLADARYAKSLAWLLNEWGIIASEWAALRELYRPGCRGPVELGLAIGMSKGGASKLIDRLVLRGLVKKEVSKFDRRFRAVELTSDGKDVVEILASADEDFNREFFGLIGTGRRKRLMESLKRALGPGQKAHMERWLSVNRDLGEPVFLGEWWSGVGRRPPRDPFFGTSEWDLRLIGESPASGH